MNIVCTLFWYIMSKQKASKNNLRAMLDPEAYPVPCLGRIVLILAWPDVPRKPSGHDLKWHKA